MQETQSKKPLNTFDLAVEVSKGSDQIDQLSARLHRYSTAKNRALENLDELDHIVPQSMEEGVLNSKAVRRLRVCGTYLEFRHFYTIGKVKLNKASFCSQPLLCPLCAIRRAAKALDAYLKVHAAIIAENPSWQLSMITMTVKNGNNLEERFKHLYMSLKRVFKHRRDWLDKGWGLTEWRKVHGWVGTYEVTKDGGKGEVKETGWHPHAHIIVLHTEQFDYRALRDEWRSITKDSHVFKVSKALHPDNPALDFAEVFKYSVKFSDLTPAQNVDVWKALRGKRLLFSGGAFRGVKIPESLTDDLQSLEGLPYIEMFYRYAFGEYRLASTTDVKPGESCLLQPTREVESVEDFDKRIF